MPDKAKLHAEVDAYYSSRIEFLSQKLGYLYTTGVRRMWAYEKRCIDLTGERLPRIVNIKAGRDAGSEPV